MHGSPASDGTTSSARGFFGREGNRGDGSGGSGGGGGRAGRLLLAWQKGKSLPRCTESGAAADPAWSGVHTLLASAALLATERLAIIFEVQLERFFLFFTRTYMYNIYLYLYIFYIYLYIFISPFLLPRRKIRNRSKKHFFFSALQMWQFQSYGAFLFFNVGRMQWRETHTHARTRDLVVEVRRRGAKRCAAAAASGLAIGLVIVKLSPLSYNSAREEQGGRDVVLPIHGTCGTGRRLLLSHVCRAAGDAGRARV